MTAEIEDRKVHIVEHGTGGPLLFWGVGAQQSEDIWKAAETLSELSERKSFTIAAFEAANWNNDFSPWKAPAVYGKDNFSGEGRKTLDWLCQKAVPWLDSRIAHSDKYIAGYSLAGLFALWSMYESSAFDGAVCCSGSLWFPGWRQYAQANAGQINGDIYLSLGIREERTRNTVMASVGDNTRYQYELLKSCKNVCRFALEWNQGGHFTNINERMIRGFQWILQTISQLSDE